jgi:hypothetical protein
MTSPVDDKGIVERLRAQARTNSDIHKEISASKSARNQASGDALAEYDYARPEQMLEWEAASLIERLTSERDEALAKLESDICPDCYRNRKAVQKATDW